jgi:hypothetical protein
MYHPPQEGGIGVRGKGGVYDGSPPTPHPAPGPCVGVGGLRRIQSPCLSSNRPSPGGGVYDGSPPTPLPAPGPRVGVGGLRRIPSPCLSSNRPSPGGVGGGVYDGTRPWLRGDPKRRTSEPGIQNRPPSPRAFRNQSPSTDTAPGEKFLTCGGAGVDTPRLKESESRELRPLVPKGPVKSRPRHDRGISPAPATKKRSCQAPSTFSV